MKYDRTQNNYMGYGDKPRPGRVNHFVKALHLGNGDLANNIDGFVWAKSYEYHADTIEVDCTDKLSKPNGICTCPKHTWMYGQAFPEAKKNRNITGWTKNYCSAKMGFRHAGKCELVDLDKNTWAACPSNSYMVGIGRGEDTNMSNAKVKCCELEFKEAFRERLTPLPSELYSVDKKYVGFRTTSDLQYISSDDKTGIASMNTGAYDAKAKLRIEQPSDAMVNNGNYNVRTIGNKYWKCSANSNDLTITPGVDQQNG